MALVTKVLWQSAGDEEAVPAEDEIQAEVETDAAQVALVIAKRQAPELTADCMVYRYGSLATSVDVIRKLTQFLLLQQFILYPYTISYYALIEIVWFHSVKISLSTYFNPAEGIESVEIVQMSNVVSMATELDQNAVDVTITCQGRWAVTFINYTS